MARVRDEEVIQMVQRAFGEQDAEALDDEAALDFAIDAVSEDERKLLAQRRREARARLRAAG